MFRGTYRQGGGQGQAVARGPVPAVARLPGRGGADGAARTGRRGAFNTAVTFGAIHLYSLYFERLQASAGMVPGAGLIAIAIAWGAWLANERLAGQEAGEGIAPPPGM